MDTLKQEITRQLEELSPEELQAVHQLITTFKRPSERTQDENAEQPAQSNALAPEAVRIRDGRRDTSSLRSGRTLKALPRYRSGRKVREALGHVSGSLSDVIAEEREERI